MSETQAASSPAEVDVFGGIEPTHAEFSKWRDTGEVPARFKPAEPADPAPADAPQQTVDEAEIAPESDPDEVQEPPQKGSPAQKRILQLLAEKKELQRKLDATAKPDATPAPSPEQAQQQSNRPKPTVDAVDKDGKAKYATYEEYVEDLADWKAEGQVAKFQQAQRQQAELQVLKSKLDDARARYEDADSVIFPAAEAIKDAHIPPAVKEIFSQSEYFPDLCYVVGSDPAEMAAFLSLAQTNPRAALAKVFEYERGIAAELAKAGKEPDGGTAPEKKQTQAPKPPSPVGGGSSRAFDVSDESLSADEWARKRNKQLGKV